MEFFDPKQSRSWSRIWHKENVVTASAPDPRMFNLGPLVEWPRNAPWYTPQMGSSMGRLAKKPRRYMMTSKASQPGSNVTKFSCNKQKLPKAFGNSLSGGTSVSTLGVGLEPCLRMAYIISVGAYGRLFGGNDLLTADWSATVARSVTDHWLWSKAHERGYVKKLRTSRFDKIDFGKIKTWHRSQPWHLLNRILDRSCGFLPISSTRDEIYFPRGAFRFSIDMGAQKEAMESQRCFI